MIFGQYNNRVTLTSNDFCRIIGLDEGKYKYMLRSGKISLAKKACKNNISQVAFDSIPEKYRQKIVEKHGDPYKLPDLKKSDFEKSIEPDPRAAEFFASFKLQDGKNLPTAKQREYTTTAEILNTVSRLVVSRTLMRKVRGGRLGGIWEDMAFQVNGLDTSDYPHKLPTNHRRLKDRVKKYQEQGYLALIHKGYCNSNSRKVNERLERLMLSLYIRPEKPYASTVHDDYLSFLAGQINIADFDTGEVFDREEFYKNGSPIMIDDRTVLNYINKNRHIVDKFRSTAHDYNSFSRPHHHRHAPNFSLSKISLDDRDLPRKLENGKRLKAYYSYDVKSGVCLGASYSRSKNSDLYIGCLRDMFQFIDRNDLGVPMEAEVEHHIVSQYKDDLMRAGEVFPMVRWCAPTNSQEKRAEHFNKAKKYGFEKRYQQGIGRFYAKLEANRVKAEKMATEDNETYKERLYTEAELIADDRDVIDKYNNSLHPNQKKYKEMTRMDVLLSTVNPSVTSYDENRHVITRYIGDSTVTSIRRNDYCQVQHAFYQLPAPEVLEKLEHGNKGVTAYYIPGNDGTISGVHLWQGDRFICEAKKVDRYNEATAEQTSNDRRIMSDQAAHVKAFDDYIKTKADGLAKVKVTNNDKVKMKAVAKEAKEVPESPPPKDDWGNLMDMYKDFGNNAQSDI